MSYMVNTYLSYAVTATASFVVVETIDAKEKKNLCITVSNSATAATVVHLLVEASLKEEPSAANTAPTWFAINTSTYPYASSVAATGTIGFVIAPNPFKALRITARTSVTATAGTLIFRVGGDE